MHSLETSCNRIDLRQKSQTFKLCTQLLTVYSFNSDYFILGKTTIINTNN